MTTSPAHVPARLLRCGTVVIAGTLLLAGPAPGVASASAPTLSVGGEVPESWVVYQSSLRDGEFGPEGIFLIRLDGSEDHEIATDLPGEHVHPAWAHDGRHILFAADIGDVRQLAVVGSPGSGARLIGHCAGDCLGDDDPSFAPDDRTLAYTEASAPFIPVGGDDFPSRIELRVGTLGADGVQRARTIYRAAPRVALDEPRWSPDGSRLLFWQERYAADGENTGTAIFTIRPDGRGLRQITPWSRFAGEADWSPDGRSIVFVTHPLIVFNFDQVVSNLFTVGPDGRELRALTHFTTPDVRATQARWTPEGSIIFTRVDSTGRTLATVDRGGRHLTLIPPGARPIRTHGDVRPASHRHPIHH